MTPVNWVINKWLQRGAAVGLDMRLWLSRRKPAARTSPAPDASRLSLTTQLSQVVSVPPPRWALRKDSAVRQGRLLEKEKTYLRSWQTKRERKKPTITSLHLRGLKCNNKNNNYRLEPDKGYPLALTWKGSATVYYTSRQTTHLICVSACTVPSSI